MKNIQFGDVNRFLVSMGIALIGLAIIIPYLFLKEDFGLYLDQETIEKLQDPLQKILTDKQNIISVIQHFLPIVSILLFLFGVLSIIIGLFRWFRRQAKIDEKFDKEIVKLDLEVQALSPEETEQKAIQETQEIAEEERVNNIKSAVKTTPHEYLEIERRISDVFKIYNSPNFDVLTQIKIGNRFNIDIILQANTKKYSDRIIEIKYYKNYLPLTSIEQGLYQLATATSHYRNVINKLVVPVFIIVYNDNVINPEQAEEYQQKVEYFQSGRAVLQRLKIEFISENNIDKFDVRKILKR